MPACPRCSESVPAIARICGHCGASLVGDDDALTAHEPTTFLPSQAATQLPADRPASDNRRPVRSSSGGGRPGSRSGSLTSSDSGDHGRFAPGTTLANRYRIVARLGRGGMGEVYRADDLKLDTPVALKFLPEELERDPEKLAQLHGEVRVARQIAHKNVCRMYDVEEAEGLPFLTMEYVDGEDLASLLRRIGRLPGDKALDVARQLCAGLAAAHERGVLHRDLKPANVMIDGEGQVRLTDFGLAALGHEIEHVRSGTPAYMAPEQLKGEEVSVRSDLYALGLVLYELFTGRRAYNARTVAELMRLHEESSVVPAEEVVPDLDPAVARAIERCLEREPERRPRSALAVAASLPGGDPLAAALAAGETPSPAMVAAAGQANAISPALAGAALAALIAGLVLVAALVGRYGMLGRVPFDKPPEVLTDRAQSLLVDLGYTTPPADTFWDFLIDQDYLAYLREEPERAREDPYGRGRPSPYYFYLRTSPRSLIPYGNTAMVNSENPPLTISGMTTTVLDPQGRLRTFHAVPPQRLDPDAAPVAADVSWDRLFQAAQLDPARFREVEPRWTPRSHADVRRAWEGPLPERPDITMRVEAAAFRGLPVYFDVIGPWTRPTRQQEQAGSDAGRALAVFAALGFCVILTAALVVVRANLRARRGDRTGALRCAAVAASAPLVAWVLGASHTIEIPAEMNRFFAAVGNSLFIGGLVWLLYLALEPWVRRFWPDSLKAWSRLLAGRIVDARVGRDLLIGVGVGLMMSLDIVLRDLVQPLLGYPGLASITGNPDFLQGLPVTLARATEQVFDSMLDGMWIVFVLVGLRLALRRMWLVWGGGTVFLLFTATGNLYAGQPGALWLNVLLALILVTVILVLVVRFGLLAAIVAVYVHDMTINAPLTLDPGRWYFTQGATVMALVLALAVFGAYAAVRPAERH